MAVINFVTEWRALWGLSVDLGLSAAARVLLMALFDLFNQAARGNDWPGSLVISNHELTRRSGLTANTIHRARDELQGAGLLSFQPGTGRRAGAVYTLRFVSGTDDGGQADDFTDDERETVRGLYYKALGCNPTGAELRTICARVFRPSPLAGDVLGELFNQLGLAHPRKPAAWVARTVEDWRAAGADDSYVVLVRHLEGRKKGAV